jgi:hypothetical protein
LETALLSDVKFWNIFLSDYCFDGVSIYFTTVMGFICYPPPKLCKRLD